MNMNFDNDEESLEFVNGLLERLHQAGYRTLGSIAVNIYKPGSQHVDHVENQYIGAHPQPLPKGGELQAGTGARRGVEQLPEVLRTDKAMALWRKVQAAGYVDEDCQPRISRTQAALLADAMAVRLGIREKWKVFEGLWNRKYMRSDYNLALSRKRSLVFQDELKRLFG
mgnify:CR=1 FL=1